MDAPILIVILLVVWFYLLYYLNQIVLAGGI